MTSAGKRSKYYGNLALRGSAVNNCLSPASRVDEISFHVGESRNHRDEARLKAIRAAKEKAVALATELGQTIGKPWDISEQSGWNANQTVANSSFGYNSPRAEEDGSTVAPGQVTIRASVRVSFQLE